MTGEGFTLWSVKTLQSYHTFPTLQPCFLWNELHFCAHRCVTLQTPDIDVTMSWSLQRIKTFDDKIIRREVKHMKSASKVLFINRIGGGRSIPLAGGHHNAHVTLVETGAYMQISFASAAIATMVAIHRPWSGPWREWIEWSRTWW